MSPDPEVTLSSRITLVPVAPIALVAVTLMATAIAALVGWAGVPQARALASSTLIESAVMTDTPTCPEPDFSEAVALAVPDEAVEQMLAPLVERPAIKKRSVSRVRTLRVGPWRTARVSWYGPGFYGNTMAGGGKLRRDSMVVAHRSMKFGTRIAFSYKGRTVTAVVRDRGPYIAGRTFDLGPGIAKALRFQGVGVVRYRVL